MNMMRQAEQWLKEQRRNYLAETVKYIRRDGKVYSIPATRGRTMFRAENDYGVSVVIRSVDFIVAYEDMNFYPDKGDEIHVDGERYEVLAPNDEPVWRWSGMDNTSLRIHSKAIGEVLNEE
jgi:hypothetical protein